MVPSKEYQKEWASILLERLEKVNVQFLYSLVVQIFAMTKMRSVRMFIVGIGSLCSQRFVKPPSLKTSIAKRTVSTKDTSGHVAKLQLNVVDMVCSFYSFGSRELLRKLIQAFVDQSRLHKNQHSLKQLLQSNVVWKIWLVQ